MIKQKDHPWIIFTKALSNTTAYQLSIVAIVCLDVILILYKSNLLIKSEYPSTMFIEPFRLLFFSIYTLDLVIRVSAQVETFFRNGYNLCDIFVIIVYILVFTLESNNPLEFTRGLGVLRGFVLIN